MDSEHDGPPRKEDFQDPPFEWFVEISRDSKIPQEYFEEDFSDLFAESDVSDELLPIHNHSLKPCCQCGETPTARRIISDGLLNGSFMIRCCREPVVHYDINRLAQFWNETVADNPDWTVSR